MRDIAQKMARSEMLRLLEAAFEAAAHATLIADREGRIVWVNPAFTAITGYLAEEVLGQRTSLLKSGKQDPTYYTDLWETITAGRTWRGVLLNRRKDGSLYSEQMSITPIRDNAGEITHFVAVKEDITEAVRMQELLRRTSDRYERLFEYSPLALLEEDYSEAKKILDELKASGIIDLESWFQNNSEAARSCAKRIRIVDVNRALITMFGATDKHDCIGELEKFFTESSYADLQEQLIYLAAGNLNFTKEVQNVMRTGKLLNLKLSLSIAPKFANCWSEVIISLEDISERIRHEKQLSHATKIEAVGQLTGGIAHDFNNVLTVVDGNLQLIKEMFGDEMRQDMGEMIDDALSATEDGAKLTSRLLAFSRRPEPESDMLEVNGHLEDFAILMNRTLGNGINVETRLADDLGRVKTDKSALGNAYLNLSLNARDAMPDGGKLTFTTRKGIIDKNMVDGSQSTVLRPCIIIEIADTGCGMSPDVLAKATDPFFTTKGLEHGSGLGLSMVYDFLRESGGDLRINSTPGAGTSIEMYLPIEPVKER